MEKSTKKAAKRTHKHREDGEEAVKQAGKVIPIDAGRGNESAEGKANVPPAKKPEQE